MRRLAQKGAPLVKPRMSWREHKRAMLVAGLLTPDCEDCPAKRGEWCDYMLVPPVQFVRVDRNPPRVIHSSRIAAAADGGHVSRRLLIDQFAGGELPAGLTQPAARR